MKKYLLFIAVIAVIAGCTKKEVNHDDPIDIWNGYENLKYSTLTVDLYAGQNILVGTLEYVITDDAYFEATYTITGGWEMSESHLYAGDYDEMPINKPGAPKVGKFPFKATHNPAVTTYTYSIPVVDLPEGNTGFVIAAHCVVNNPEGGNETGWATGNKTFSDKGWGTYLDNYYENAMDIVIIYGIEQNSDGTLNLIHINASSGEGEIILTESILTEGIVSSAAYEQSTGNLFFVIGNILFVNNLNEDTESLEIGTITGSASGGTFLNNNYYYFDATTNQIIEVLLTFDETDGWSLTENYNYSTDVLYDLYVTDLANDGSVIYLIGINNNGTADDDSDDTIELVTYANGSFSDPISTQLIGVSQIAFGASGDLYAVDADNVLTYLNPESGITTDTDDSDDVISIDGLSSLAGGTLF